MRTIAHIINPVIVGESSDLFVAQPITFETMKIAREFARGKVDVAFFSAQYPEDRGFVPPEFQLTPDLDRSILDVGTFQKKRKLPLLKEILDRLYEASDAEYFIYTNVDIALMPHFYVAVNQFMESGHDALVINRRTISNRYQTTDEIPLMYAEVGKPHEGHDCFVFRRDVYPQYRLGLGCIGIAYADTALLWNLAARAKNFKEFKNEHLTFHVGPGNDQAWQGKENDAYRIHNKRELLAVMAELERECGPFDRKGALFPYRLFVKGPEDLKTRIKLWYWWLAGFRSFRAKSA